MAWIAAAGPASNLVLAAVSTLLLAIVYHSPGEGNFREIVLNFLQISVHLNVFLAIFNWLPIPPLDGFMMLESLVPAKFFPYLYRLSKYGFAIMLVLFFTGVFEFLIVTPSMFIIEGLFSLVV